MRAPCPYVAERQKGGEYLTRVTTGYARYIWRSTGRRGKQEQKGGVLILPHTRRVWQLWS